MKQQLSISFNQYTPAFYFHGGVMLSFTDDLCDLPEILI